LFLAHQLAVSKLNVNFISRPSQKFLSDNSGILQLLYILPLTKASAVALKEHRRFLFLYSFATKCVNSDDIYFVCLEAQALAKKQFSLSFLLGK